jgi:hypothetical protein
MVDAAGLLRPPVAMDNAAMQTEAAKAESPNRRRRQFQFSLRTLIEVGPRTIHWASIVRSNADAPRTLTVL